MADAAFDAAAWTALLGNELQGQGGKNVNVSDALHGKDCIGLYFSAHWSPPCRAFTPQLAEIYKELKKTKNFELVFVSSDKDENQFNDYFAEMPWLALPYNEREKKGKLSSKFKVNGIPCLVLLNADGTVITTKGRSVVSNMASYPWRPRSVRQILGLDDGEGATLVNKDGESKAVADVLGGVDVIALYFSAHWCGPCRQFTPKLAEQYKALKDAGKSFELVFVSSDKSADDMKEYMGEMPWWGLPFDKRGEKEELSNNFDVEGIPSLVFIDAKTGETITKNGRGGISAPTFVEDFPYHPKPVNDLSVTADGINENASLIVFLDGITGGEASKAEALAAIQAVAETAFKLPEDDRTVGRFFTVKEKNELGNRVRQMCKLENKDSPQMVILDIPDNGGFYLSPAADVSEASVNMFVEEFKTKSISRSQLS